MQYLDRQTRPINTIEDILAYEREPLTSRGLPGTTYEAFKMGAEAHPCAKALSFFFSARTLHRPFTLTHKQLFEKITQAANAFRRLGAERDDTIAILLPNLPETHFVIWGGSAASKIIAINPLLEASQINEILRLSNAKIVVTLEKTPYTNVWEKVAVAIEGIETLEHILVCNFFPYLEAHGVLADAKGPPLSVISPISGVQISRLVDEMNKEYGRRLNFEPPKPHDTSTMLCTGGSTGMPKIVRRTHAAEVYNAWAASRYAPAAFGVGKTALCGLPLFHAHALTASGLVPLMMGGHVVLTGPAGFRGDEIFSHFWRIVEHYKVSTFSAAPAVFAKLLELPHANLDTTSVEFAISGGAPMSIGLLERFENEIGIRVMEAYGMTETVAGAAMNPVHAQTLRSGSIGLRFPYQDMAIAILDDDGNFDRWAENDEPGLILVSGPNVFDGYLIEEQNTGIWFEIDGKKWFNTGDIARQDADSFFWLIGRQKDLIIRYGENIDPAAIEEAVLSHPGVDCVAAVPRPDPVAGEVPVIYYQLCQNTNCDAQELERHTREALSDHAADPADFIETEEIPVSPIGKVDKVKLRLAEIERVIRAEAKAAKAPINAICLKQDARRGLVASVDARENAKALKHRLQNYVITVDFVKLPDPKLVRDPLAGLLNK